MKIVQDLGERGFEALLEAAPDGILVVDEAGEIVLANRRAEQLFGYPAGALVRLSVDTLVPERLRHGHRARRDGYMADPHVRPMGAELELFGRRRDGADFPVEISLSALRSDAGLRVVTIVRDVTERLALEAEAEALRQRSLQAVSDAARRGLALDRLLPAVLEPASDALRAKVAAVALRDPETGLLKARAVRGLPAGVLGTELVMAGGIGVRAAADGAVIFRDAGALLEPRWRDLAPAHMIGTPLVLGDVVVGVVVAGRDAPAFSMDEAALLGRLAERIALAVRQGQLYEAAHAAETRLREILGDVAGIVWESEDGERRRYEFVSGGAEALLGYATAAWTEQDGLWRRIIDPADREDVLATVARAVAAHRDHELEYRVRTADGRTVWLRDRVRVIDGRPGGVRLRGLMVDVTEQRELETNLLHAQKMQAVGQLAGGVAHDFNNMLTAIIGYSGLLAARLEDREALEELAEIERAAERAQGLTEQLLSFSRRQGPRSELVDLSELVAGVESMLRRLIDEDIDLVLGLAGQGVLVEADAGRLEQALVNLVINARDAMPGRGTLTVGVDARMDDGVPVAALWIRDTGTGMDERTRLRAFEAFFTTKAPGKGTGLGLSTVYGIVDELGGRIAVESEPGVGTEITLLLPLSASDTPEADDVPPTILIVEDEAALRKLVRRVLEADGKRVLEAGDGREALRVLEQEAGAIDLLITDVVMPEMSGPELVEHVSRRWPELRVVFSSGYTDSRLAGRGFDEDAVEMLRKPYTIDALRQRVAQELDRGSPSR